MRQNTDHTYVTIKDFMFREDCPRPQVQDAWKQNLASCIQGLVLATTLSCLLEKGKASWMFILANNKHQ